MIIPEIALSKLRLLPMIIKYNAQLCNNKKFNEYTLIKYSLTVINDKTTVIRERILAYTH